MRQNIYFCRSWFHYWGQPSDPITRDEAEAIFHREKMGEGFYVLVDDPNRPTACLWYIVDASGKKGYKVDYLDEIGRKWLGYSFRQIRDDRLFLDGSGEGTYSGDNREADEDLGEIYTEDGLIRFSRKRRGEDFRDTWKDRLTALEHHYEPLPVFGEYDSILRIERDRPWEKQKPWSGPSLSELKG